MRDIEFTKLALSDLAKIRRESEDRWGVEQRDWYSAQISRRLLGRALVFRLLRFEPKNRNRNAPSLSRGADEYFVRVRFFSAPAVIDVDDSNF